MKNFVIIVLFTLIYNWGRAQSQPVIIDLAALSQTETHIVDIDAPATISIDVINAIYPFKTKYRVRWEYTKLDVFGDPLIYIPPDQPIEPHEILKQDNNPCVNAYSKWVKKITTNENDEKQIPKDLNDAETEIKKVCTDSTAQIDALREFTVVRKFLEHQIEKGWQLSINISRIDGSGTWKVTYRSKTFDHWRVFYGVSFLFNLMTPTTTYFAKSTGNGQYVITANGRDPVLTFHDFAPLVFYTWLPEHTYSPLTKKERDKLKADYCCPRIRNSIRMVLVGNNLYRTGFSFGLNANLARFSCFAAPSLIIGNNVSLSFGAAIYPKYQLKKQYEPGETIEEPLDFDQLHQLGWNPEWFLCLAFRFNSAPFIEKK